MCSLFIFGVHPINVESVAWIAERKNVLSTLFFFLTLAAYGWYARKPLWSRYCALVVLFVCGLMSKPMLVTLPFVLLLMDYWPLERIEKTGFPKLVSEKLPLFVLSLVSSVVTFKAQQAGHAMDSATRLSFAVRTENAILAYALYLWKAIWPSRLAVFYPHPGASVSIWSIAAASLVLVIITGLCIAFRGKKYLLTGWFWFLGTLVPVIGIVQVGNQAMADRYAYVPLIGVFLMLTWATADLFQSHKISRTVSATVSIAVLLALSATTYRQIGYWSSDAELWSHTLAVTTNNSLAQGKLGWALMASNEPAEALPRLREAAAMVPADPTNHINLGICLDANHEPKAAIEEYKKAIGVTSDPEQLASAYTDLGGAYDEVGNYPQAHESYDRALLLNPKLSTAYFNRGLLLEKEGHVEGAVADYQHSVELQPTAKAYLGLSRALQRLNRISEAQASYEKAMKLASDPTALPLL